MELIGLIEQLFAKYGYLVLLIGLPLDAIASPIPPGNTTLTFTGYLSYKGILAAWPALAAAFVGASLGITVTYWIGLHVGNPLFERYGKWLVQPKHLEKTRSAYEKYGNKVLLMSYFAPGFRQFIGYFVGFLQIPFRIFALYAYTGAALWVTFFWGIGYFFGNQWQVVFRLVEQYLKYFFIVLAIFLVGILLYRRQRRMKTQTKKLDREVK